MNRRPADIDAYLADVPADARATLEKLRDMIRAIAPEAVESISYGMPAFKLQGKPLAYFGAAKNHCALYGLDAAQAAQAGYEVSKGTIRFPKDQPPPEDLVRTLLNTRIAAIGAASAMGRKASGS